MKVNKLYCTTVVKILYFEKNKESFFEYFEMVIVVEEWSNPIKIW